MVEKPIGQATLTLNLRVKMVSVMILFLVGETGKSSAELTLEEKNSQSHRALAVKSFWRYFHHGNKPSLSMAPMEY